MRSRALCPWSTRKVLEALRRSATGTGIVTAIVRIIGGMDITNPTPIVRIIGGMDITEPIDYYGYPLDLETYAVRRNLRPTWFNDY